MRITIATKLWSAFGTLILILVIKAVQMIEDFWLATATLPSA